MMPNSNSKQCIFCLGFFDELTREHVIPYAIGGVLTIESVCKTCNSLLGERVDAHLVDNFFSKFMRAELGIEPRKGKLKHPLTHGMLADDPKVRTRWNLLPGEESRIHIEPRVKVIPDGTSGGTISIRLDAEDADKLPEILRKIEERSRKKGWKLTMSETIPEPVKSDSIDLGYDIYLNTIKIKAAIAKIFYEVACTHMGEPFLQSMAAEKIRRFLNSKNMSLSDLENSGIQNNTLLFAEMFNLFPFITDSDHMIVLIGNPINRVYVRISQFFDGLFPTYNLSLDDSGSFTEAIFYIFHAKSRTFETLDLQQVFSKYLKGV